MTNRNLAWRLQQQSKQPPTERETTLTISWKEVREHCKDERPHFFFQNHAAALASAKLFMIFSNLGLHGIWCPITAGLRREGQSARFSFDGTKRKKTWHWRVAIRSQKTSTKARKSQLELVPCRKAPRADWLSTKKTTRHPWKWLPKIRRAQTTMRVSYTQIWVRLRFK